MQKIKALIASIVFAAISIGSALAQSGPGFPTTFGYVATPAQWLAAFTNKQDYLGAPPVLTTGGTMTGRLVTAASTTGLAGLSIPAGTPPTSPINGDVWETSTSLFVRINGATYDLLNGACSICAVTNGNNTFTGLQTTQGLTTTQPGWYAQITGDTFARTRIGPNSADIGSVSFGPGNAARDTHMERAGVASLRFGSADGAAPIAQTLLVQNVIAGTSNTAGVSWTLQGSRGTGTGAGGNIVFQVAPAGLTGSSQNPLSTALTIFGLDGGLSTGAAIDEGVGTLNLAGSLYNNGTAPTGTGGYARATSPAFVTPALGVATATSLAIGGATIGSNALAVTGTFAFSAGGTFGGAVNGITTLASGADTITSSSTSALAVGLNGATNPAFVVDASTASQAAGLSIKGAATGGTVALAAIDSGSNTNLSINAKGTGTIAIGSVSTGAVTITPATTLSAALTYGGTTFANSATGSGSLVGGTSPTLTSPVLNTSLSGSAFGTGVPVAIAANLSANGGLTTTIASGATAMGAGAISSGTCASAVTATATNAATTDVITASFNADPTAVTGYIASTNGMLTIIPWLTSGQANFKVCNNTGSSITPGAVTINWRVVR
jgi:hypothetical protein